MFSAYDDIDIGALETEEIEGTLGMESDMLKKAAEEFELNMKRVIKSQLYILFNKLNQMLLLCLLIL